MKRLRRVGVWFLTVLALLTALPFLVIPFSSEPSDPEKLESLAPAEIITDGFSEPTGLVIDS
ncbi:MAG: hypothetical protein HYV04_15640, partial [Deltaproteobacteria bacterium]|nr:hypothetical protein [Deltaproteobacteria bacterium]